MLTTVFVYCLTVTSHPPWKLSDSIPTETNKINKDLSWLNKAVDDSQVLGTEGEGLLFGEPQIFACHFHKSYLTESSQLLYRNDIFHVHFTDGGIEA